MSKNSKFETKRHRPVSPSSSLLSIQLETPEMMQRQKGELWNMVRSRRGGLGPLDWGDHTVAGGIMLPPPTEEPARPGISWPLTWNRRQHRQVPFFPGTNRSYPGTTSKGGQQEPFHRSAARVRGLLPCWAWGTPFHWETAVCLAATVTVVSPQQMAQLGSPVVPMDPQLSSPAQAHRVARRHK